MGRRKIEIQPITHERNRSVTFLKRKNGLFKKAYELGVLCSVDVAVIIFEERPGHHLKLYQYCSTDIHDIVQRHLRHDGEKDTRGPQDFSGNANAKMDDIGDGDDDDPEDDDDGPGKRRGDSKLKRGTDLTMSNDLDFIHNRGLAIPPPPLPMHGIPSGSSLPISSDRHNLRTHPHSSHPSKRPRTGHPSLHSRSPSDDHLPSGSTGYHYQTGSSFSRSGGQYHHSGNSQYTPLYPVPNHTPPPPVFIPLQPDFASSSSRGPAPRSGAGPPPPAAFSTARSSSSGSSYDANMYGGMMRPPPSSSHPGGGGAGGGSGGNDLFSAFLDADEHSRQSQNQSFGLDWPVHNSNQGSAPPGSNTGPAVSNPSANSSGAAEGSSNWLDFLSANPNPTTSGRDPSMSWERSGGDSRGDITEMFNSGGGGGGGGGSGGTSGQATSPLNVGMGPMSNKRARVGSEVDDASGVAGLGGSPGSVNGLGSDKKDMKSEGGG